MLSVALRESHAAARPVISGFAPGAGGAGTEVTLFGVGFTEGAEVSLGGVRAACRRVGAGTLRVTVPAGAATGALKIVTRAGVAYSLTAFRVTD